ncbi:MAG TPA: hypothetical protein VL986_05860 [Terracidiphilus sp.]|nr:hypothetical protein [Terracidiphilus sp.]
MTLFKLLSCLVLLILAVSSLVSHAQTGDSIRILAVPEGARNPTQQVAEMPLHIPYPGRIDRSRSIFVRVFSGSPEDQIKRLPRDLRVGDCVLYTSSGRFPAHFDGNGALRIDEVVDFFNLNIGHSTQILTLVFEEGDDGSSPGPLKLSRDSVKTYFANAMKLPLLVSDREQRIWDEQIAKLKRQEKEQQSARGGGFFSWFRPTPVQAAEASVSTSPPTSPANHSSVVNGPCDQVLVLPFVRSAANADIADSEISPLSPVAHMVVRRCSL